MFSKTAELIIAGLRTFCFLVNFLYGPSIFLVFRHNAFIKTVKTNLLTTHLPFYIILMIMQTGKYMYMYVVC